eukprot:CAMPEP_0116152868 /NCGR_PEP_ID=MMETSP0329-20121206/20914_1 /TAXON_ID=697910 /ORGANISM="Pseudo-nitzschia arenysensis, Strain B593" /LENGTH=510 /DNA_ID=CAMNT_0003649685 /DNA_START=31 /DNA_END=1559 /DNA_ORIENTATION=+
MGKKKQRAGVSNTKAPPASKKNANGHSAEKKSSSSGGSDLGLLIGLFFGFPFCTIKFLGWFLISIPFWVFTQPLQLIFGRPPVLQSWSQSWRFLCHYTWLHPSVPIHRKIYLTFAILEHTTKSPIFAFCWILDEVLYGRQLNRLKLGGESDGNNVDNDDDIGIVFVVSGYRSASTHLARSLLEDESMNPETTPILSIASPNSMMMSVPYLWVWNYVSYFVGDLTETEEEAKTKDETPSLHPTLSKSVRTWYREKYSSECLERHDFDPFAIDTLDLSFLSCHLNTLAWDYCLESKSSDIVSNEFNYAKHTIENKDLYEKDFVRYIDRLARKTLLFHQQGTTNPNTTILFKGHFLSIAPALQARYPSAKFVTVLRDPCDRLKSAINYTAVNPSISGRMNRRNDDEWKILAATLAETEAEYCLQELKTFSTTESDPGSFLSIHYDAIANSSQQQAETIRAVQGWIVGKEGSTVSSKGARNSASKKQVTTSKKTKKTKKYTVDKTLHELGIDET